MKWTRTVDGVPDDGTHVVVITLTGDERNLFFDRGLWWVPDQSMYVYFVPVFWRKVTVQEMYDALVNKGWTVVAPGHSDEWDNHLRGAYARLMKGS